MKDELQQRMNAALNGLMTYKERRSLQVWCEDWRGWFVVVAVFLLAMSALLLFYLFVVSTFSQWVQYIVFGVVFFATIKFGMGIDQWRDRRTARRVMVRLQSKGVRPHLCLSCDYDLRGSVALACPECGTGLASVDGAVGDDELAAE